MQKACIPGALCLLLYSTMAVALSLAAQTARFLNETGSGINLPAKKRKIVRNGIKRWMDASGKKNKNAGIAFSFYAHNAHQPAPLFFPHLMPPKKMGIACPPTAIPAGLPRLKTQLGKTGK